MKKILSILSIIVLFSCSKSEDQIIDSPSAENYILDFRISVNGSIIIGTVNETDNTISLVTLNANVESISPVITISANSDISPNSNVPQDFSEPVTYRVTSEDGSVRTYQVTISNQNISLNDENKLLAFTLPIAGEEVVGTIDEANKVVNFNVAGADLTNLTPTVQISENATISPSASVAQNFKNVVAYTIIASDGTPAIYRVIVNNRPLSTENEIKLFSISNGTVTSEAIINREDGIISFDFGDLDRTNLTPAIEISEYASVSPSLDNPQDFTNPVVYVVTAENGDQFQYKVIANLPVISNDGLGNVTSKFFSGAIIVVVGKFIDLSLPNSKIELSDGTNKYPLEIITATNSFNGLIQNSRITATIPASTPTNTNYEIIYSGIGFQHVSDYTVDIKQENSPLPLTVDKMEYNYDDELIITGENLTEYIGIPSLNGSFYLMDPRGSEITLNADRTELRVILDIRQLFPSYFGREAQEFNISFFDSERRIGRTIPATFN
jgi:hypothetical protein